MSQGVEESRTGKFKLSEVLDVRIADTEQRIEPKKTVKLNSSYVVYLIHTRVVEKRYATQFTNEARVWRRFSDFEQLRKYLEVTYPSALVAPLPDKKIISSNVTPDRYDPRFIEVRRIGLEKFLRRLCSDETLSADRILRDFLQNESVDFKEHVRQTGYEAKAENIFQKMSVSFRLASADGQFEKLKTYGTYLSQSVSAICRSESRCADRLRHVQSLYSALGKTLAEWCVIEKELGEALQKTGHALDACVASHETLFDDETQLVEELREFAFYGDVIREMCVKYELLQLTVEQLEEKFSGKREQIELLRENKPVNTVDSMRTRIFGAKSAAETGERIRQLEAEIAELDSQRRAAEAERDAFRVDALAHFEVFRETKVRELKGLLTKYCLIQVEHARKSLATWQKVRDYFADAPPKRSALSSAPVESSSLTDD